VPWICWFSLDRTCVAWTWTMQYEGSKHGEGQRPLRNARASNSEKKRHRWLCAVRRVTHSRLGLGSLSPLVIFQSPRRSSNQTMSTSNTETQVEAPATKAVVPKQKKLKPARKQVNPGDVDKETAPQTGKEYSACPSPVFLHSSACSLDGRYMV